MRTVTWRLIAALGMMGLVLGCGGDQPSVSSSTSEAKVTGKVTIRGKPMKGGEITFDPSNAQRPDAKSATGKVNADGTYEVTTLVGLNKISLMGPDIKKEPELAYGALTFEVQSGTNTHNIELPPPAEAGASTK